MARGAVFVRVCWLPLLVARGAVCAARGARGMYKYMLFSFPAAKREKKWVF
ncbi:hypothetical protein A2U01_0078150 [Trifolium medium]|uniref:Uncharacterized protein n=1 Tax=Trifolium medium TaxID=97028 RepID=A0A392T795_9FABA|nr:hypothetical protein [Trifolium medium]